MCDYLGLPVGTEKVNTLNGKFDVDRFFCLIGTNPKDYTVAAGWSARLVGPFSDGLVRTDNASVFDSVGDAGATKLAPRAFVYRSHSGYYGIVNSEEGYQNLTRFLFGDVRIDGSLEVRDITLPGDVEQARVAGTGTRLISIRSRGAGSRRALGFKPSCREREFCAVSNIRRAVS